jgi:hypothetical protein
MSNPAAEFFTAPIEFVEAIKSQTKPISAVASAPSSTSGPSLGKVVVIGLAGIVAFWQLTEWYKRMEKIHYPEPRKSESIYE